MMDNTQAQMNRLQDQRKKVNGDENFVYIKADDPK